MLVCEHRDVSLQALNLIVGVYLQPFEGIYNICTCNNIERVYSIHTYNMDTYIHRSYL